MSNIAFIPPGAVYTTALFTLAKITKAKNIIYFHTAYADVYFSCAYQFLDSARLFSTAILLSLRQFTVTKALLLKK